MVDIIGLMGTNNQLGNESSQRGLTRRSFVIEVGGGSVAAIAGYVIAQRRPFSHTNSLESAGDDHPKPRLKHGVIFGKDDFLTTLSLPGEPEGVMIAVNENGAGILSQLDGTATVSDIANEYARKKHIASDNCLEAKMALFVAEVAMCGFLDAPFHANIFECRVEA